MFGIDSGELLVVGLVALLVIGPKDLPRVMRLIGQWVAKGRAMTRHVRAGFDTMLREAELEEMQKQWAAQNEAIMKASALPDFKPPDLGLNAALPDLSADEWMNPPAAPAEEPPAAAPAPPPAPRKRTRARKPDDPTAATPGPKRPRRKTQPTDA